MVHDTTSLYVEDRAQESTKLYVSSAPFVDVRNERGKLIFRFDPQRMLVEWRDGKEYELIDLTRYMRT